MAKMQRLYPAWTIFDDDASRPESSPDGPKPAPIDPALDAKPTAAIIIGMAELGVNIDHVATLRQARRTNEPDPVWAAVLAELGGADGITLHLREDRRHIQDRDLRILRETVAVKLNLEMACDRQVVEIACQVKPDQATLGSGTPRGDHHRGRAGRRRHSAAAWPRSSPGSTTPASP